jgi:hypothetical protein
VLQEPPLKAAVTGDCHKPCFIGLFYGSTPIASTTLKEHEHRFYNVEGTTVADAERYGLQGLIIINVEGT